ncbi:MAG: hypothetical protein Fur006_53710 [Coleofasciculaceae cyanobacterium]|jgi:hypothetical protein
MNIPTNLAEELKLYLKQQANNGDFEAQALLLQLQQVATPLPATVQQPMDVTPPESQSLGC